MQTFWPSGRGVGLLTQRDLRRAGSNPADVGLLAIADVRTSAEHAKSSLGGVLELLGAILERSRAILDALTPRGP